MAAERQLRRRSIPHITSAEPLWDQPGLAKDDRAGRLLICRKRRPAGARPIVTAPIEATPPISAAPAGPGWTPFLGAVLHRRVLHATDGKGDFPRDDQRRARRSRRSLPWMWRSEPEPVAAVDIGGGIKLPTYATGSLSHSWAGDDRAYAWSRVRSISPTSFPISICGRVSPQLWP